MRCPKCSREIAFDAMEHALCGWKLPSKSVPQPAPARKVLQRANPVKPEIREALDLLLKKFKTREQEKRKREPRKAEGVIVEVTPGHGRCYCELCWKVKMSHAYRYPKPKEVDDEKPGESGAEGDAAGA